MPEKEHPSANDVISFGRYRLYPSERRLEKGGVTLPLSGRALDILIALTERVGEVVEKNELIARVWPDATVGDGSLRFHVASLRKVLEDGEPGTNFVTNVSGRGYCLVAAVSRSREARVAPKPREIMYRPDSLPLRLERMVGREEVVCTTANQLLARRFVTIVGPGGIGKTTVALAVADALLGKFENAVYFVDFSPLADASLAAATLASALGLSVRTDNSIGNIVSFLRDRQALIVLDCCEHLIEATATLAEQIFQEAPRAYILATSRESLRVEGEYVHRLLPLDSPPDNDLEITAAEAAKYPAIKLFVERAAARLYQFELLDADAPVVAKICRKLDGIALAIELAAGRVDTHGVAGIAELLDDRFSLLSQGRRTALPRHQTLLAALDWSYDLLPEPERAVLRRLSVFAGTFTLEAAQTVAAAGDITAAQAVDAVVNLVAKSLLTADVRGPLARYRLLDTTRAYARQKLDECDEARLYSRRHAEHYRDAYQRSEAYAAAGSRPDDLAAYAVDIDNVRAALEWGLSPDGDPALAFALAAASSTLFLELSLLAECCAWAERALALPASFNRDLREEMLLQMTLGISILNTLGNTGEAYRALMRALELTEKLNELHYQLHTLEALNLFYQRIPDMRTVQDIAVRGEVVINALSDRTGRRLTNWMMGLSKLFAGDHAIALEYSRSAVQNAPIGRPVRRFGIDRRNNAMIQLARALWILGYPDQSMETARTVLREERNLNHGVSGCVALHWMACLSLWNGDLVLAERLVAMLLDRAVKNSLVPFHGLALGWDGVLSLYQGNPQESIRLLRTSQDRLDAIGHSLMKTSFLSVLAEALVAAGRRNEGLAAIDEAISRIDRTGEIIYVPEILRRKANILISGTASDRAVADDLLLRSLECARGQGALSWELRTSTTLARLRRLQGRPHEARAVLAPVYARFTEGFETADLRAAKRLLDELS